MRESKVNMWLPSCTNWNAESVLNHPSEERKIDILKAEWAVQLRASNFSFSSSVLLTLKLKLTRKLVPSSPCVVNSMGDALLVH